MTTDTILYRGEFYVAAMTGNTVQFGITATGAQSPQVAIGRCLSAAPFHALIRRDGVFESMAVPGNGRTGNFIRPYSFVPVAHNAK